MNVGCLRKVTAVVVQSFMFWNARLSRIVPYTIAFTAWSKLPRTTCFYQTIPILGFFLLTVGRLGKLQGCGSILNVPESSPVQNCSNRCTSRAWVRTPVDHDPSIPYSCSRFPSFDCWVSKIILLISPILGTPTRSPNKVSQRGLRLSAHGFALWTLISSISMGPFLVEVLLF